MALRGKNSLIKRYPLPMVKRAVVVDSSGWGNATQSITFTKLVAEECTIQRPKARELEVLNQGLSVDNVFVLRTNSNVHPPIDGTNTLGMSIYIPDAILGVNGDVTNTSGRGGWYSCISCTPYASEVIEHNRALLVKDTTIVDDKGVTQYPQTDIDAILTQIDTKDKLRSKGWVTAWQTP